MRAPAALATLVLTGCLGFHTGPMPGEPKDATFLQVEGARIRYVDRGQGPAVVLLHGFASSIENWLTVMPVLEQNHRVLAIDLKGFGWSDRPVGDYSPRAQARMLKALMDERGIEKAALVAHSWGSSIALAFALDYPERVTRLALYDAWAYESQLPTMFHLARAKGLGEVLFAAFYGERPDERMQLAFYNPDAVTEQLAEDVERAMKRPATRAAALEAVRGMDFTELETHYREVKAPTLLLWGREDVVTPVSIGERLLRELPRARLEIYPRCGHFPMLEAASQSTRDLAAFLEAQP